MDLDETVKKLAACTTVDAAATELLACVTSAMRDVEAMSEWQALADALDAHAADLAQAVADAAEPTPQP
jgi:hypothetical protein